MRGRLRFFQFFDIVELLGIDRLALGRSRHSLPVDIKMEMKFLNRAFSALVQHRVIKPISGGRTYTY
jgi:hypothetical protein